MKTDLSALSVREYAELLGSDSPSPGGGSAAAAVAALGVSLAEMTCRINAKRGKSNPDPVKSAENAAHLAPLRERLLELVTRDAEVFEAVSKLWKDQTPELEPALEAASAVPLEIASLCVQALAISQTEIYRTSQHLISDLIESAVVLEAAFGAACLNVEINLKAMKNITLPQRARGTLAELANKVGEAANAFAKMR